MANDASTDETVQSMPANNTADVEHPTEQLEIEENGVPENETIYPTGPKLWLTLATLCVTMFLKGLDLTIVAVAVPSLTDQFKTVTDIGWYNAAYGLTLSAFVFFFGKVYTVFSIKYVFIFGIVAFEFGSLLCTLATSSKMFIIGRAIAGLGSSAMGAGNVKMLRILFPLSKQALWGGVVGGIQSVGLVAAPMIGGALIDAFSWRACFGINLPLGVFCIAFTAYGFHDPDPVPNSDPSLPFWEKVKRINLLGTLLVVPALSCFLMALQWGGSTYGWGDWRIILMFVSFGLLFSAFGYTQKRQGEQATLPIRIIRKRSVLAGLWYSACCDGILAVTENYISIYFKG